MMVMQLPVGDSALALWVCSLALPILGWFQFIIPALSALGGVLGGAAKGASEGRQNQALYQANQNNALTSQYGIQQGATTAAATAEEKAKIERALLDLQRRGFALQAPSQRMSNAARGSQLANVQDVQVSHPRAHVPTVTGGIRPSNLTPEARSLGALIARQSLMDQMQGDQFSEVPMQDWRSTILPRPGAQAYPEASGFEKFGSVMGLVGSGLGSIQDALQQYITPKKTPPGYWGEPSGE